MSVVQSQALPTELCMPSPSPEACRSALAAAGYDRAFVELSSELAASRERRSNSNASTSPSVWSKSSSLVRSNSHRSARWSVTSSQAVLEELLDAALAVEACEQPQPARRKLLSHSSTPSSFSLAAPRPLSLASSTRSMLLPPDRSSSPTPSFVSALSAGDYHRKRQQHQRSAQRGVISADADTRRQYDDDDGGGGGGNGESVFGLATAPARRSMSPVVSLGSAKSTLHWRSRTLSPVPLPSGPPPTIPLPPTPRTARASLTNRASAMSALSARRRAREASATMAGPTANDLALRLNNDDDGISRKRAEALAALEGRQLGTSLELHW